jgi:hypothetical protein
MYKTIMMVVLLVLAIFINGTCIASDKERPWDIHYNTELWAGGEHRKCHEDTAKAMMGQGWSVDSMVEIMFAVCNDKWLYLVGSQHSRVRTFCENEKGYNCESNTKAVDRLSNEDHRKEWRDWVLKIIFDNRIIKK